MTSYDDHDDELTILPVHWGDKAKWEQRCKINDCKPQLDSSVQSTNGHIPATVGRLQDCSIIANR